jgi:hypothetical protein
MRTFRVRAAPPRRRVAIQKCAIRGHFVLHRDIAGYRAETDTGGRLFLAKDLVERERFCLTYGDSLVDFNLDRSLQILEAENARGFSAPIKCLFLTGHCRWRALALRVSPKKISIFRQCGFLCSGAVSAGRCNAC